MAKQAGTRTPRSRGAYGSTRGKERQRRRADNRERDPRYIEAMEETRRHQEELDALIARQKSEPAEGAAAGALYAAELKKKEAELAKAQEAEAEAKAVEAATVSAEPEPKPKPKKAVSKKPAAGSKKFSVTKLRQHGRNEGEPDWQFGLTTARMMLKSGYHIEKVLEYTGVGYLDVQELPLDEDGFGITETRQCFLDKSLDEQIAEKITTALDGERTEFVEDLTDSIMDLIQKAFPLYFSKDREDATATVM